MLHIILVILKILGIIILTILGLFLALLLAVLLVPVRYGMRTVYHGDLKVYGKVNWLLHMISFKLTYDKEVSVSVRLFGIRLFPRRAKKSRKTSVMREELLSIQEVPSGDDRPEEETISEQIYTKQEPVKHIAPDAEATVRKAGKKPKKKGIFYKITAFFKKMKRLIKSWFKKCKSLKINIEKAKAFILDEENKKTFKLILNQVKKLVGHVFPGRIKGQITFGFEDPYTTGQILTFAGILYPLYNNKLKITPIFDHFVLDGELYLKGRIRLATMLLLTVRVYFNKNFRMLLKRWMG